MIQTPKIISYIIQIMKILLLVEMLTKKKHHIIVLKKATTWFPLFKEEKQTKKDL